MGINDDNDKKVKDNEPKAECYDKWDYDYKKEVLTNYEEDEPIKNFLRFRKNKPKHLENNPNVIKIFSAVFGYEGEYRDVMNSFWYTYKFFLQLEYPNIFRPVHHYKNRKIIRVSKPIDDNLTDVSNSHGPLVGNVHQKYIDYYKKNDDLFPSNIENDKFNNYIKNKSKIKWYDFLLDNYDLFSKVHDNKNLRKFARLTHTIGNFTIVPKGFNAGRHNFDYWDFALLSLKKFLDTISPSTFNNYIKKHKLTYYVENLDDGTIKPLELWKGHLLEKDDKGNKNPNIKPKSVKDIEDFLRTVNAKIEKRGNEICEIYKKSR